MINKFAKELIRRRVHRALGAYIIILWLFAQGAVDILPAIGLPEWLVRALLIVAGLATPLVALLAWKYDLTSKGFLRDRMDVVAARKNVLARAIGPTERSLSRHDPGFSIVKVSWLNDKGEDCMREFQSAFEIGRDYQADIRLQDDRVSRRHIKVYPIEEVWYLKDLASLNGTYVDGQTIDVRKIEQDLEASLDKDGPRIRLTVHAPEETTRSVNTGITHR